MIDIKKLNQNKDAIVANLARRGYELKAERIIDLMHEIKQLNLVLENLHAKANKNENTPEDKIRLKEIKKTIQIKELQLYDLTVFIPNTIHPTVPEGKGAQDNPVIKEDDKTHNAFYHDYCQVGKKFGLNTEAGAMLAGARFNVMQGKAAILHRKLINAALDFYGHRGYEEFYVPNLVKENTIFGTAQYPKFKEEIFTTENNNEPLFLIPTGEVPLTNLVKDSILKQQQANLKMMTHTPCFRKEAGAYGRDTRGIIRQHQFEKVELIRTCLPEEGLNNLNQMMEDVECFIKQLGLKWRIIELCAGDLGFAGHKAYDFELWFGHEKMWREIATITWCTDFQARRMNAKYKPLDGKQKPQYLHTLNGTGLAAGRVLAAMFENCYDGKVLHLPPILN